MFLPTIDSPKFSAVQYHLKMLYYVAINLEIKVLEYGHLLVILKEVTENTIIL